MALDKRNSPTRRHAPSEQPTFYARMRGGVEYVCPHCGRFQKTKVNYRRPRHRCHNRQCNRILEFGVIGWPRLVEVPPRTAIFDELNTSDCANSFGRVPLGALDAIGQVTGPVEWWCTACDTRNQAKPVRGVGSVHCKRCKTAVFIRLCLRKPLPGAHVETPPDWIPPNV